MTKTATVQAQQRWEYKELTRKTEGYLLNELAEMGQIGWELVSVIKHREMKPGSGEAWYWTAFLKRPLAARAPTAVASGEAAAPAAAGAISGPARLEPSTRGGGADDFAFAKEEVGASAAEQAARSAEQVAARSAKLAGGGSAEHASKE